MRRLSMSLVMLCFVNLVWGQTEIPFYYTNHIVLKGLVNKEHAARLVLDSGADGLYLDSTYFAEAKIPIVRRQLATLPGAGSTPQQIVVVLDTVRTSFQGIEYIPRFVPLISLRSILGQDVDGIIGLSFLRNYIAQLDYKNRTLKLINPNDFQTPEGWESIPFELIRNRIIVDLEIGIKEGLVLNEKFQIDLGNGGTVDITSPTAKEHRLSERIEKKLSYLNVSGGVGGEIRGNQFRANYLKFGNFRIEKPVLDYSIDTAGALAKEEMGGLLGNEILERFDVIFDFTNSRLLVKPNGKAADFHSTLTGFSYTNRRKEFGGLLVTGLFENTHASAADMRIGDVITHINDHAVPSLHPSDIPKMFEKPGSQVVLKIKREEQNLTINLVLKDYL